MPMPPTLDPQPLAHAIAEVIASEIDRSRGTRPTCVLPRAESAVHDLPLDGEEIGLTSLELLSAAAAVADRFDLRRHGVEDYLLRRRTIAEWAALVAECVDERTAFTFCSSGSTGEPVATAHRLSQLQSEARELLAQLRGVKRVRSFVPARHLYGFIWGVVLPSVAGIDVLSCQATPDPLQRGDLLVSYPDHWAFLAASKTPLPAGIHGLSSTAPLNLETRDRLHARGLATLTEIYGSSQTAGVGWRREGDSPYTLFRHWRDLSPPQASPAILQHRDGTAAPLQDHLEILDARSFRIAGRVDRAVQVSGMNVYPARVRAVLEANEHVGSARVRLDAATGALSALIVPAVTHGWDDARRGDLEQQVAATCRHALAPYERPQRFTFAPRIPTGEMGKETAWS